MDLGDGRLLRNIFAKSVSVARICLYVDQRHRGSGLPCPEIRTRHCSACRCSPAGCCWRRRSPGIRAVRPRRLGLEGIAPASAPWRAGVRRATDTLTSGAARRGGPRPPARVGKKSSSVGKPIRTCGPMITVMFARLEGEVWGSGYAQIAGIWRDIISASRPDRAVAVSLSLANLTSPNCSRSATP